MVNENEITQPELNLVSEESTAPVAEPQAEPAIEAPTEAPVESTSEVTTSETTETESSAPKAEESVGKYPGYDSESNVQKTLNETKERLKEVERQNTQQRVIYEAEQYKQQLVQQGYSVEQANSAAQQHYQTKSNQMAVEQNYQEQLQIMEGQYKAALHYGKQFNIDPEVLRNYKTPQEMEQAAKHQSEVRALKEENAKLKKQQVPAQSYDNSQAPANASSSEERLLDLYNSGVRNPDTEAAARRAAGIG